MKEGSLPLLLAVDGVAAEEVWVVEVASDFLVVEVAAPATPPFTCAELTVAAGGLRRVAEVVLDASDDFEEHLPLLLFLRRRALPAPEPSGMSMMGSVI